jgi:hypothetical protein
VAAGRGGAGDSGNSPDPKYEEQYKEGIPSVGSRLLTIKDVGLIESEKGCCEKSDEAAIGQSVAHECD